jgi:hypothetical protein
MVRSGSTLQYNLVRQLIEESGNGLAHGWLSKERLCHKRTSLLTWARDNKIHVIKSHVLPNFESNLLDGKIKYCYIYRDIRDVAVSIKLKWNVENGSLYSRLDNAIKTYYNVVKLKPVILQRYEDIIGNMSIAVQQICDFIDISPNKEQINQIVLKNSVDNSLLIAKSSHKSLINALKKLLKKTCSSLHLGDLCRKLDVSGKYVVAFRDACEIYDSHATLLHPDHISANKGAIGVWKSQLSKAEQDIITKQFYKWLQETNYIS